VASRPEGRSFTDLREDLGGVPSMTLTRALEPLLEHTFLAKDPRDGRYRIGARFTALMRAAADNTSLEERVEPILRRLAEETGHSTAYFHWDGEWGYVRAKVEVAESFHYAALGHRKHPATHTFLRPIFAHLKARECQRIGAGLDHKTRDRIRQSGFDEQTEHLRFAIYRITAPVFAGEGGPITGALGITSLILRFTSRERTALIEQVVRAAKETTLKFTHLPS